MKETSSQYSIDKRKARLRRRKRRKAGLLCFMAFTVLLLGTALWLVFSVLSRPASAEAAAPSAEPSPAVSVSEAPPADLPPAEASPLPSPVPCIAEDWYIARCQQLYRQMKDYGGYADDAAVYLAMEHMQIDPEQKMVALTFDDGPCAPYTEEILDILEKNGARATFFVKGAYIDGGVASLKRMLGLGCEIGNHTMNHDNLEKLTPAEVRETVKGVNDKIKALLNYDIHLLRPPYIAYGDKDSPERQAIVSVATELQLAIINHTRSSHDTYEEYTPEMIIERMTAEKDELGRGIDGSIFLFHDKYRKTVDSVAVIIPALQAAGYQLVTVSELLQCSSEGLHYGWIYSKAD